MIPPTQVRYHKLTERPEIPYGYLSLKENETIKPGDALPFGQDWIPVTPISIGQTVKAYPSYVRKEAA
jgi:hypothetical protein